MFEQMESLEPRQLLAGNMFDIPDVPINFADVAITLLPEDAPRAARSFIQLRDQGKLVDVIMHRAQPNANAARAGLFRQRPTGLEFAPRTKRIDAGQSLPTVAGTVGFMRDPDNPRRTTGEIVFNRVDRPGVRSNMVVFGTFTDLSRASLFFDLRDQVEIERSDLLGSVPAHSGSTFDNIDHLEFGLGRLSLPSHRTRLGGFATSDSAEWLSIRNITDAVQSYEVQLRADNEFFDRIVARGEVGPGERVVVRLHVGENLQGEQRDMHFPGSTDQEINARAIRQNQPYALKISLTQRLPIHLERLERDPEFGVVRSMRLNSSASLPRGRQRQFGPMDFDNDGAQSRLMLLNESDVPSVVRIKGVNDLGESFSFVQTIAAFRPFAVDLDQLPEVNGHVASIKVRGLEGFVRVLLIDGQADFSENATAATRSVGATRTSFMQRRLRESSPLELFIFNSNTGTLTITVEVSLVVCNGPGECPADPPDVPSFEPFELRAGQMMRFPFEGEALLFDRDFVFRLISRGGHPVDSRVHLYFDPAMLEDL